MTAPLKDMIRIPAGAFLMGSDDHYPEEAPVRRVAVGGFWIDRYAVTNAAFRRFVKATGYVTVAERAPDPAAYPGAHPASLVPGSVVFRQPPRRVDLGDYRNWWAYTPGANWRHPQGPGSTLHGLERHPVVHIAYEDALDYAEWAGKDLPSEAEWEYAARGGLDGAIYAWGDDFAPKARLMANTWQGEFPSQNLCQDGYAGTAPVGSFPPNGYGLFDMIGNVWEWTDDWWEPHRRAATAAPCCYASGSPSGAGDEGTPRATPTGIPEKVIKGGSYLCAPNYCRRYRPAARSPQAIDTGACHVGFRCIVRDP